MDAAFILQYLPFVSVINFFLNIWIIVQLIDMKVDIALLQGSTEQRKLRR